MNWSRRILKMRTSGKFKKDDCSVQSWFELHLLQWTVTVPPDNLFSSAIESESHTSRLINGSPILSLKAGLLVRHLGQRYNVVNEEHNTALSTPADKSSTRTYPRISEASCCVLQRKGVPCRSEERFSRNAELIVKSWFTGMTCRTTVQCGKRGTQYSLVNSCG